MISADRRLEYLTQIYRLRQRLHSPEVAKTRRELAALSDQIRSEWRSRTGRLYDSQDREERLREATTDQIRAGQDDALTFLLVESAKCRTLLDQMARRLKEASDPDAAGNLLAREKEMLRFSAEIDNSLMMEQMRLASNLVVVSPFETEEKTKALAELEAVYEQAGGGFEGVEPPVPLADLSALLKPGELMIEFWIPYRLVEGRMECSALCITAETFRVLPIALDSLKVHGFAGVMWIDGRAPVDATPLADRVVTIRTNIAQGREEDARAGLREMHDLFLAPVIQAGFDPRAFERWIVIPAGPLHGLPFGALLDSGNTPLYEKVGVVTVPSATVWARNARRTRQPVGRMLAFGDPLFSTAAKLSPLPQAREEVRDIARELEGVESDIYMGAEATESRLISQSRYASILHLATHATFPESDAIDLHRVALTAGGGQDGELRAEEIRRLDLSRTDLAVLSVCNGGIYRFGPGGELHGLVGAFLAAGARNVLATMWTIDDRAGRRFVVDFYASLLQHGPAEALRRTARKLREAGAPIVEWASFVLVGDGRPLS